MADFVQSFSQGVETGSSLVARARQQRLQQQNIEIAQQQEDRLQALQPLALAERQMENQITGIKLAQALQDKAYQVEINKAFLEAGELLKHGDPADPKTAMAVLDRLIKVPSAKNDPRFKAVMDALDNAQQLKVQRDRLAIMDANADERMGIQREGLGIRRDAVNNASVNAQERIRVARDRLEFSKDQAATLNETAKVRNEIAQKNAELRELELQVRLDEMGNKLSPVDRAAMEAKLKSIADDVRLIGKREERDKQIEAVAAEFAAKVGKNAVKHVRVIAPNGKTGFIPADQLDEAIKNGYRQVQ